MKKIYHKDMKKQIESLMATLIKYYHPYFLVLSTNYTVLHWNSVYKFPSSSMSTKLSITCSYILSDISFLYKQMNSTQLFGRLK